MTVADAAQVPREVHCARVLDELLQAVRRRAPSPDQLVSYTELPASIWERIGPAFGLPFSESDVATLRAAALAHAKDPQRPFVPDADEKRTASQTLSPDIVSRMLSAYEWIERPIAQ